MIIKSIEAIGVKYTYGQEHAYGMARGLSPFRGSTLVFVETDEGITGVGEAWGVGDQCIEQIKALAPLYIDKDPFDREIILLRALSSLYHLGKSGPHISSISGIDMALWDILGKATGQPIAKLLGGKTRKKIMAYASTGYLTATSSREELAAQIEQSVENGFQAIKIKIGVSPESDRERVKLIREIAGNDFLILVDANGNYKRESAVRSAKMIEEFNIHWYEEPLPPEDLDGFRFLKERTSIPLATGEALFTRHGFRPYIAEGLVDYIQPDLSKCGGLSEAKAIVDLAITWNLNISAHVWGTAVGVAAALQFMAHLPSHPHTLHEPFPALFEYDISVNPLRTQLVSNATIPNDGYISIPDRPGLGITVDYDFIHSLKKEGCIYTLHKSDQFCGVSKP